MTETTSSSTSKFHSGRDMPIAQRQTMDAYAQQRDNEFTAQLIDMVRRSSILYDHSHKQSRNTEKKFEAWTYIKNRLDYAGDPQDLADYWKIVRDRYTKAKRKVVSHKPTKFPFLKELSFLDPHITDRSNWYEKIVDGQVVKVPRGPIIRDAAFYMRLIDFVKSHPCFYDITDPNYRKFDVKVNLWRDIGKELNFSSNHQDVYKQWKKLRDRYVREKRKMRNSRRARSSWDLFQKMEWMEPYIEEPRPFEEYESMISTDESPKPMPIIENGRQTATIRILKPAADTTPSKLLTRRNAAASASSKYMMETNEPECEVGEPVVYVERDDVHGREAYIIPSGEHAVQEGDVVYEISATTDLETLPPQVAATIRAHGRDMMKTAGVLYISAPTE